VRYLGFPEADPKNTACPVHRAVWHSESVRLELQEDLYEWSLRQRRDKERWEGLGNDAVRDGRFQR
jgi:hypothetical protein